MHGILIVLHCVRKETYIIQVLLKIKAISGALIGGRGKGKHSYIRVVYMYVYPPPPPRKFWHMQSRKVW